MLLKNSKAVVQRCAVKKGVLRNFAMFLGKHLCQSLFFNKVAGLRPATLLKKRLWHRHFPVNFAKFLRTPLVAGSEDCVSTRKYWRNSNFIKKRLRHRCFRCFFYRINFIKKKKTSIQVFSCEYYEIFMSSFFMEHLQELLMMKGYSCFYSWC